MSNPSKNLVLAWAVRMIIYLVLSSSLVFLSAGDWAYPGGWWFVGLQILNTLGTGFLLVIDRPELMARRSQVGEGTQGWDQILARLMAFSTLIISLIAALGVRFDGGWGVSLWGRIVGVLLATAGHLLTIWAMRVNPFFEGTTRIQAEHDHHAVTRGPYRWVRHPGYLGVTLYNAALPLVPRVAREAERRAIHWSPA